ncbi:lysozyme [Folsomia candida]|uniref:lysozyme n=1 Tax=Folsomia candida TaxID=158441 RepID=UPI000B8F7F88|nr:lysozyme [Folsomia candida]
MYQQLASLICSLVFIVLLINGGDGQEISDECLGCICHASSGCNKNQGCTDGGVCGPFLLTWPFWADAGKLMIKGSNPTNAYSDCSNDLYCAAESVRSYARKYAKDCNQDGIIDCEDFARIHKNGPGACGDLQLLQTEYYQKFAQCKAKVNPQ